MKKSIPLICLWSIILFSCATSYTTIQVLKPAQFSVTQDIKTICILNRAHVRKNSNVLAIFQELTDNQALDVGWQNSKMVISQFIADVTSNSPRFTINPLSIDTVYGTGNANFPQPLEINMVSKICAANNAQALVALEAFEVVPKITYSQSGTTVTCRAVYQATLGWRFYDPKNQQMLDEFKSTYNKTFTGTGATEALAKKNLPTTDKCVKDVLIPAANAYVSRISPVYENVSRSFHKKGSPNIVAGYQLTQKGDWKGAADAWLPEVTNPDPKISGMAIYNIAVSYEVLGNLNEALVWAKRAEDKKTKWASRYVQILNTRIAELNQVRAQMGN